MALRSLFCGLLSVFLCQSCVARVYTWREVPDITRWPELTAAERAAEKAKYTIKELRLISDGHYIGFSTGADPDTTYDLFSYAPVMGLVYPQAQQDFHRAQSIEQTGKAVSYGYLGAGVAYGAWSLYQLNSYSRSDNPRLEPVLWTFLLGALTYLGWTAWFATQEIEVYNQLKTGFNTGLETALEE